MDQSTADNKRFIRAKYRVSQLRSYYIHLLVFLLANLMISGVKIAFSLRAGNSWHDAIFNLDTFVVWIIWGIFMLVHTFRVIGLPLILGYDWESRKLEEYVEDELKKEHNFKV